DLFFETKFYTAWDIVNHACEGNILELVRKFTENIIVDFNYFIDYGANSFRFVFEGHEAKDRVSVILRLYNISADINRGLSAKIVYEYGYKELYLDDVEKLLNSIDLPVVSNVTEMRSGLKIKNIKKSVNYEEIEYEKEYKPLYCNCKHEPTWIYNYKRPIGITLKERSYTEEYLVLDVREETEDYE
ncbi:MAG: hypothetical protein KZY55_08665, partial [Paeniclostridium sp.]